MTDIPHYQELTVDLAAETAKAVLVVYAAYQTAQVGPNVAAAAIASVIATANAAATTLADLFVSAQIESQTRVPQPPTGIVPRDDTVRLTRAVETILDDLPEAEPPAKLDPVEAVDGSDTAPDAPDEPDPFRTAAKRLERLARAEPLDTGQAITVEVMSRIPRAAGWRRALDADPCPRCIQWAEDGRTFPTDHPFKRHVGCACTAEVVVDNRERITL